MASTLFTNLQLLAHGSLVLFTSLYANTKHVPPQELYSPLIPQKVLRTYSSLPNPIEYPQWTDKAHLAKWDYFIPDTWTSGFFPATLYEMNTRQALCKENPDAAGLGRDWLGMGRKASDGLVNLPGHNTQGHDVGFLAFAFMEELKVNPQNETAKNTVNAFAKELAARYVPGARVTRSWDSDDPSRVRVIIDNMMNLEMLFVSAGLTGDNSLKEIAINHAKTTMQNHIRPDGSTWHVIEYSAETGEVLSKRTAQGYADDSVWSRGQGWAIYGFTQMYQWTGDLDFLHTARRLATYFLNNVPKDGVVPWDFKAPLQDPKAPGGVRPADSSAATVAATALLVLASSELDSWEAEKWTWGAIGILESISKLAWNPTWDSLLSNGTVNWPGDNYLTGVVYGDHYFIKAGNELVKMGLASC
ncbi:hypothetical protein AAF712_002419 [Marasmius tenuissimus]|uniref:Glycoside hydrolase family 88 protein n=1 Tax=Marasmius tenuissimus TaxID=585030 RepID=A0ABR3AAM7_9AGAR